MTQFVHPPQTLLRRWGAMPPWQAKRARAAWWRENGRDGQDPARQVPALPVRQPSRESFTGPRRLTNEELGRRNARRVELDDPNFAGTLTKEDLAIASPATVTRLLNSGKIHRDLGGPPPGRR